MRMRTVRLSVTFPDLSVLDEGLLLSLCFLLAVVDSASAEGEKVSAVVGGDAVLPCNAERFLPLEVVEWSRPGTNIEFVLIYKPKNLDLDVPLPRYQGRVELKDRETGDVSLVLRNVTAEDEGTYQCYVLGDRSRRKRAVYQPISTVYLHVAPPPPSPPPPPSGRQHLGLFVGVVLAVLGALVVAVFTLAARISVFAWKKKNSLHPPPSLNEGVKTTEVRLNVEDHSEPTSDSSPFLDERNPDITS